MKLPLTGRRFAAPLISSALLLAFAGPGQAQDQEQGANQDTAQNIGQNTGPSRTRVTIGAQLVPSYPGADSVSFGPLIGVSRARGDEEFAFRAPDQSFGFPIFQAGKFFVGPSIGFQGKRSQSDLGAPLPEVGFTVEVGAYAQYLPNQNFRLSAEVRRGIGGHNGVISLIGADYLARDGDRQLFSIGPRVTLTDGNYQDAYFSVAPADAVATGLAPYDLKGGIQSVGATAGYLRQFTPRWGMYTYLKYDKLVGGVADSPVVERFGSADQYSGGVALTYTFGRGVGAR